MKTRIVLFVEKIEKNFVQPLCDWIRTVPDACEIMLCAGNDRLLEETKAAVEACDVALPVSCAVASTLGDVLKTAAHGADDETAVVSAWSDCPFYDAELTREAYAMHTRYAAEYTFADGYPYGIVPEFLAAGTVRILSGLADMKGMSDAAFTKESLFNLLKTDINSFDIETLISPVDYRMLRLDFSYARKSGLVLCQRLAELKKTLETEKGKALSAVELCDAAAESASIMHTVPSFYGIQIAASCQGTCSYCPYPEACRARFGKEPASCSDVMPLESFKALVQQISALSGQAVVSLSLWGEATRHPEFAAFVKAVLAEPGLSVLVETSGDRVTEALIAELQAAVRDAAPRTNGFSKLMWIVGVDAATEETYRALHGENGCSLAEVSRTVHALKDAFPGDVYAQMVRLDDNEKELEAFFRGWDNRIIQKYDYLSGKLPDRKPADLRPVRRNCCNHIRRDMSILLDGTVPYCRQYLFSSSIGNVFTDGLQAVWQKTEAATADQLACRYDGMCKDCDEYYTCNF